MVAQGVKLGSRALRRLLARSKGLNRSVSRVLVSQGVRPLAIECVLRSQLHTSTPLQIDVNAAVKGVLQEELEENEDDDGEPR